MIGGLTGRPVANSTGPGTPTPIAVDVVAARARLGEGARELRLDKAEHRLGALCDVEVLGQLGENRAGEVDDRQPRVGGAEVGPEDHAAVAREDEACGGRPPVEGSSVASRTSPHSMSAVDALAESTRGSCP